MSEKITPIKPTFRRNRLFLGFLGLVACCYGLMLVYHFSVPRYAVGDSPPWIERCRELCLSYGLIPTGNIAMDAGAYLAVAKPDVLTLPLQSILDDPEFVPAGTEAHPFLGQIPPDFTLPDSSGKMVSLHELSKQGPVVLVFYYGYNCSHCVAQLFGLQKDLAYLRELGAQVVALSADPPEKTAEAFDRYGKFDFPVLSDRENKTAEIFQVFSPADGDEEEDLKHGTFIIDRSGKVIFVNRGYQPFIDNKSILFRLAGNPGKGKSKPKIKGEGES